MPIISIMQGVDRHIYIIYTCAYYIERRPIAIGLYIYTNNNGNDKAMMLSFYVRPRWPNIITTDVVFF